MIIVLRRSFNRKHQLNHRLKSYALDKLFCLNCKCLTLKAFPIATTYRSGIRALKKARIERKATWWALVSKAYIWALDREAQKNLQCTRQKALEAWFCCSFCRLIYRSIAPTFIRALKIVSRENARRTASVTRRKNYLTWAAAFDNQKTSSSQQSTPLGD